MLRDMEEMISQLKDESIRGFMGEAFKCYSVHSYRACIVLSVIAGMYDLRDKIKSLATSLKSARQLDDEIQRRLDQQNVYEKYMIEQAATDKLGILTPSERDTILSYMDTRNRSAHPGGYFPSAEEARAIFCGVIDNIISKPALLGAAYNRIIIEQIKDKLFFPDKKVNTVESVAQDIYDKMHATAIVPLCKDLVHVTTSPMDPVSGTNALGLLAGLMLVMAPEQRENVVQLISTLISKDEFSKKMFVVLLYNPTVLTHVTATDRAKIIARINDKVTDTSTNVLIKKLFSSDVLSQSERESILSKLAQAIDTIDAAFIHELLFGELLRDDEKVGVKDGLISKLRGFSIDRTIVDKLQLWEPKVAQVNLPEVDVAFYDKLLELVNHGDFYLCNEGVKMLRNLSNDLTSRMPGETRVLFVSAILRAAGRNANAAKHVLASGFTALPDYVNSFTTALQQDPTLLLSFVSSFSFEQLADFLINTSNTTVLEQCLERIVNKEAATDDYELYNIYRTVKRKDIDELESLLAELADMIHE